MRNTTHPFELILEKNRRKYRFTLLFPSVICNARLHSGILPLVLISWVAAEVAQDLWWLSSFPGIWYKPPLWISSLTKDLLEAADAGFCDAALLHWRGGTQLNSSSVFLLLYCRLCVDKSWVFPLCCVAWHIVGVDTLCAAIPQCFVCCSVGGRGGKQMRRLWGMGGSGQTIIVIPSSKWSFSWFSVREAVVLCVDIEKIIRCTEDDKGEHDDNKRRPQQRKEWWQGQRQRGEKRWRQWGGIAKRTQLILGIVFIFVLSSYPIRWKEQPPSVSDYFFLYVCEVSIKIKKKSGSYFNATWNIQISIIPSYGHVKFSVLASLLVFFDDTKDNDGANDDETQKLWNAVSSAAEAGGWIILASPRN